MNALTLLYRLRIKVLPRYFGGADSRWRWQYGSLAVVAVFVFIFVLSFGVGFFRALEEEPSLASAALSASFNLTVVLVIVLGLASALYTLYLSDDLEVLSAMPVKERAILGYKFAETMLANSLIFVLVAAPLSIAYAFVIADSAAAAVAALVVLALLTPLVLAVPTALCILFSMPLMRLLPASRAKEIVAGLGALLGAGLYVGYLLVVGGPDSDQDPDASGGASRGAASALAPLLESPASQIPPGSWAAGALSGAGSSGWSAVALGLGLLAALGAASYLLCVAIAGFSYATGRARAAEAGSRTGSGRFSGGLLGRILAPLPVAVRVVAIKELRTLRRDLRRLASVLAPVIILLGAFFVNSGGFGGGEGGPWYAYLIPYAPAVLVGGILTSVLASYSIGTEGSSYWYLQAAPVTPGAVMAGKLAASTLCGALASVLACLLIYVFSGAASVVGVIAGALGGTVAGAVLGLYGVGVSALYARFDADNPNQALTQAGNFVLGGIYIGMFATLGIAVAVTIGLAQLIPVWLAIAAATLLWTGGCAVGGYAVAAAGVASLARIDL